MQLRVLLVEDDLGSLVGAVPWYVETAANRRVIRFLGSGRVCSDYLTVFSLPERRSEVAEALAVWLTDANQTDNDDRTDFAWDRMELDGVTADDPALICLLASLQGRGCVQHTKQIDSSWQVTLPESWDEYLTKFSRSSRKKIRRQGRAMQKLGGTLIRDLTDPEQFEKAFDGFVTLHQRRWNSLGEPGCFACPKFAGFLREVSLRAVQDGSLRIRQVNFDGLPASVSFELVREGVAYLYQSGIEPDLLDQQPGHMGLISSVQHAFAEGLSKIDLLRGDEEYKSRWQAKPRELFHVQVIPDKAMAKIRHSVWLAQDQVKDWMRSGLEATGLR